jgi:hypothetical protein
MRTLALYCLVFISPSKTARAEIGDAVYRSGVTVGPIEVNWHTALAYQYDNGAKVKYVIQADGYTVAKANWNDFMGGTGNNNTFKGEMCPANMTPGLRQLAVYYATEQIGASYWNLGGNWFTFAVDPWGATDDKTWMSPNSYYQSGTGSFRCDGLVEWVYTQIYLNACNIYGLYNAFGTLGITLGFNSPYCGPEYQWGVYPYGVQTPPSGVAMTYPTSTDQNNPTISSSSSITLQASASDSQSGLSFNKPFDYYYSKYVNGAWTGWVFYGSNAGTQPVTILSANTLYSWYVVAYDNDANQTLSAFYYFKWVPGYTITASAGSGGSISPNGTITKNAGDNQAFTASPSANYVVNQWLVDSGVVQTGGTSYTLYNIQAGHSVQVTFTYAPAQYTINASAGSGGSISPNGSITKNAGDNQAFTAYPNANYVVNQWLVDSGVVQTGGTSYTLYNIQAGHSVQVTFTYAPTQYTINASAGSGGSINPSGNITKNAGDNQAFTASPSANYVVNQWLVDSGVVQTGGGSYTLYNIQAGHSVQVTFTYAPTQYTISASAGSGGTISPSGDFAKSAGSDQTFTAYPNTSYMVNQWLVDGGVVQTGGASYTLYNIQAGHSVQVTFTLGVSVTVQGNPSGVSFTVDGTTYTTGVTFTWVSGSSHPISTTSPQGGGTGVQYLWSNWSDAGRCPTRSRRPAAQHTLRISQRSIGSMRGCRQQGAARWF